MIGIAERHRITGALLIALAGLPGFITLTQSDTRAGFGLVSAFSDSSLGIQERARRKLVRLQQAVVVPADEQDEDTMIAEHDPENSIDSIDVFPIVLAAPTN